MLKRRGFGRGYNCGKYNIFQKGEAYFDPVYSTSLPINFKSLFSILRKVSKRLEIIQRDFL